jgi:hypothetical protein
MTKLIKLLLLSGIAVAASQEAVLQVSTQTVDLDGTKWCVVACEKKSNRNNRKNYITDDA